jgi:hypothetical protein
MDVSVEEDLRGDVRRRDAPCVTAATEAAGLAFEAHLRW